MKATKEINLLKTSLILAWKTGIPIRSIAYGKLSSDDWAILTYAASNFYEEPEEYAELVNIAFGEEMNDRPSEEELKRRFTYFFRLMSERIDFR